MLNIVAEFAKENNLNISAVQLDQLECFCSFLAEKNKSLNLTSIEDPLEVEVKHLVDSLEAAPIIERLKSGKDFSLVDVGTGAGFPGIPLKIVFPEAKFTLLDSLQKRVKFLLEASDLLKLKNISCVAARAEEFGRTENREQFDFCVSRAVAQMNVLLEYCLPLVKPGGYCLLYKSGDFEQELANAETALKVLCGGFIKAETFELPKGFGTRSILIIKKPGETPDKYPRRPGKPQKSPLI